MIACNKCKYQDWPGSNLAFWWSKLHSRDFSIMLVPFFLILKNASLIINVSDVKVTFENLCRKYFDFV